MNKSAAKGPERAKNSQGLAGGMGRAGITLERIIWLSKFEQNGHFPMMWDDFEVIFGAS